MSPKILNYVGEIAPAQITVDIHPRRGAMGLGRRMRRARASGGESGGGWMRTAEKPGTDEQLY